MNEKGTLRIRERYFKAFYAALNQASDISGKHVWIIYELWLSAVIEGLSQEELLDELLTLLDDA